MLDAILSPEWEYRYFSFNSKWGKHDQLASMRNGSGDEYFVGFNDSGVVIKGFDHESDMSPYASDDMHIWPGVVDTVPVEFASFLKDPAFPSEYTTFCLWRLDSDTQWRTGKIEYPVSNSNADGSTTQLFALDGQPDTYTEFATGYYEMEIDGLAVERIYRLEPLTEELIAKLNPEIKIKELLEDIDEIGYPVA